MTKEEEYFSFVRHELRNQLGIIREGVSQIIDGLGKGDCSRCNMILKPTLECSDKLNSLIEKLVSVPEFEKMVEPGNSSVEAFKRDVMIVIDHEIRTPLAIVQEGLSLVADEIPGKLNPKQKELLKNVKDAMNRLCQVVEKILLTPAVQLKGENMSRKKKILLVDDEVNFLEVVKRRLSEGDYEVIAAGSGEQALALVTSDKPDVILLDIMMPGIDGLEVLKSIRKQDKNLPVYIITAFSDDERFKTARSAGASGFIAKTDDLKKALDGIMSVINVAGKYKGKT